MIKTQISSFPNTLNPVQLYRELCEQRGRQNTLMLESADVHTKAGQKSFLMIKAALKFRSLKDKVVVTAISPLGEYLLSRLVIGASIPVESQSPKEVVFIISAPLNDESLSDQLQRPSSLDVLRDAIKLSKLFVDVDPEQFLVAGIFSYDLVDQFENLPAARSDPHEFPDYIFWLPEIFVVIDHIRSQTQVIQHHLGSVEDFTVAFSKDAAGIGMPSTGADVSFHDVSVDLSDNEYTHLVEKLKERVVVGDVFQIVPSRTFTIPCPDSLLAYEHLKAINPSPYMYYVVDDAFELCGASPETFIKFDANSRLVDVKPIAGTRRRGVEASGKIDMELDSRLEAELRLDTKELAEHMMLVDLARNDIARVSELGTRQVYRLLSVERFSHVMHLVSQVRGELRKGLDGLHAYQASMNMGTLVGAPKIKAAEILRQNEVSKRGTYGGAIGYLDAAGNFDTAIIIRSALVENGIAHVRAGAGVVYDSIPLEETTETKSKASAVLKAIQYANAAQVER